MVKTVIFDMDGVIVDTEPLHYLVNKEHHKALNIEVTDEVYSTFTGTSNKNYFQTLKNMFELADEVDDLITYKNDIFLEAFDHSEDLDLLPGVKDLIQDLFQNGVELILASSSEKVIIDKVFERFGLAPYFSHRVSGEDFPESKPNPAIFEYAAALSKASKSECIVIEDSTNGIKAAKAAGIYCIGYIGEHSGLQDTALADKVIRHFSELNYDIIQQLKATEDTK